MNARRHLIRLTAATTALGLGTLALTGCGKNAASGDGTTEGGKLKVAASFYPMQFLAEEIGKDHVQVQGLTKPGTEPHDLELSPQQTGELSQTGLIVYLKGLQPAVDEAVKQSGAKNVVEASSLTSLEKHGDDVHGEEGKEKESHAGESKEEHAKHSGPEEEGHEEKGHEGHSDAMEGGQDPHIWLDPVRYAEVAEGVGKQLAKADPKHKADYEKNTKALVDRLGSLDKKFQNGLKNKKTDTFITTHAAFGYLAERYGLHEEAVSGIDPESEPSAARMKELHGVAKKEKVQTVLFEESASDKTAKTLATDLKMKTGVLSPVETVKDPKKDDYFSVMEQNLSALQAALGSK